MTQQQETPRQIVERLARFIDQQEMARASAQALALQWQAKADEQRKEIERLTEKCANLEVWRDAPERARRITQLIETIVRLERERDVARAHVERDERLNDELAAELEAARAESRDWKRLAELRRDELNGILRDAHDLANQRDQAWAENERLQTQAADYAKTITNMAAEAGLLYKALQEIRRDVHFADETVDSPGKWQELCQEVMQRVDAVLPKAKRASKEAQRLWDAYLCPVCKCPLTGGECSNCVSSNQAEQDTSPMEETRERLAAYAHEAWSAYMDYFLSQCERSNGSFAIPHAYHVALRKQIITPYAELTEQEKDSDRAEADKMLAIVNETQLRVLARAVVESTDEVILVSASALEGVV